MLFQKANSSTATSSKSSDTALRKSDRRKLVSFILQQHQQQQGQQQQENAPTSNTLLQDVLLQDILTNSSSNSDILKRKVFVIKNAIKKNVIIYLRTPDSIATTSNSKTTAATKDKYWKFNRTMHPVFIEVEYNSCKLIVPCLSVLSIYPTMLPTVYIYGATSKFICRGANLMAVGVLTNDDIVPSSSSEEEYSLPNKKGSLVSVCVIGNPTPFAVGIWQGMNSDETSGVAVNIILGYGDDLWRMQVPKEGAVILQQDEGRHQIDDGNYGNVGFVDGTHVLPIPTEQQPSSISTLAQENNLTKEEEDKPNDEDSTDQKERNDELVIQLFYKALLHLKESMLPIPISTFYVKYYKPILQDQNISIDEKQTSFKKLSHLLLFLLRNYTYDHGHRQGDDDENDTGFILSDDRNLLCSIDKSHSYYRQAKKLYSSTLTSTNSTARKVTMVSLYIIPDHIIERMELNEQSCYDIKASNAKNDTRRGTGFLTLSEIRDILLQYCTNHNLQKKSNIELNDTLKYVLYESNKILKQKANNDIPSSTTKKDIVEIWKSCLVQAYAIVILPSNEIYEMKRGKAKPPGIRLIVERRGGNKYITKIYGLEEYSINSTLFAQDMSKRFACSCTTNALPSSSNNSTIENKYEVVVQGNLAQDIQYLLTCGMEGKSSHGNALNFSGKDFILKYDEFVIPKGICDICIKKGVPKKK